MSDVATCELCGEPMPPGEEVFNYHGYSGPCPKPPLPKAIELTVEGQTARLAAALTLLMLDRDRLRELVIQNHRRQCTSENCDLDGGPEHEAAFAHKAGTTGEAPGPATPDPTRTGP